MTGREIIDKSADTCPHLVQWNWGPCMDCLSDSIDAALEAERERRVETCGTPMTEQTLAQALEDLPYSTAFTIKWSDLAARWILAHHDEIFGVSEMKERYAAICDQMAIEADEQPHRHAPSALHEAARKIRGEKDEP
jgi:hypothetical protein